MNINREKNLVISGISFQDDEVLTNKIQLIMNKMGLDSDIMDEIEDVYRVGKKVPNTSQEDGDEEIDDRRKIMLKFKSKETKYKVF